MFQTLKAQTKSAGKSEYIIHSSISASDIINMKKHPACARCKSKKLKCTLSTDYACEKCIEHDLSCSFLESATNTSDAPALPTNANTKESQNNPSPLTEANSITCALSTQGGSTPNSGPECISYEASSNTADSSVMHDFTGETLDPLSILPDYLDSYDNFMDTIMDSPQLIADFASWTPAISHDLQMLSHESLDTTSLPAMGSCMCSHTLISTNASIQVKMVWGTHNNTCDVSMIDDMLQCQKKVLSACELLLNCGQCNGNSDLIVLVISMCREMVNGILAVSKSIQSVTRHSDLRLTIGKERETTAAPAWQLDNDEEAEMLKTLVVMRVAKFKTLLSQLEDVVSSKHQSHAWMVSILQQSLAKAET